MIHEYALEPELVALWHGPDKFHLFSGKFGFETGRVVALYPKKWPKMVWAAFEADFGRTGSTLARERMGKLLKKIKMSAIKRPERIWDDARCWFANAESEHARKPFHIILARNNPRKNNPRKNENVMCESEFLDHTEEDQDSPKDKIVPRNAGEMASCVAPMLRCATRILFIDPYFRANEERFRKPLAAFLQSVDVQTSGITIELHTADRPNAPSWIEFGRECEDKLPSFIPKGLSLTVYRWKERDGGEKLHNRYILTDRGGVSFGSGLDEGDPGQTDDVSRLGVDTYNRRLNDYKGPGFAFDPGGKVFSVEGRATG